VITDMSLPAMSGMDLAKQLLIWNPEARIVISSGYALPVEASALGRNVRLLPKPFEIEQLDTLLDDIRVLGPAVANSIAEHR
jgi:two-component system cell cycle response regulator CpdR